MNPTIEQAAELHEALIRGMYPMCYTQRINPGTYHANNQPSHGLIFSTRISPWPITHLLKDRRRHFEAGFGCIEVTITARWGGAQHDSTPRTGTEVDVQISDKTHGGSSENFKWYGTSKNVLNEIVTFDRVVDIVRSLISEARQLSTGKEILSEMRSMLDQASVEDYNLDRDGLVADIETFTRLELL